MRADVPSSITELLHERAARYGDKVALVIDDRQITYEELDQRTNAIANRLRDLGLAVGDTVASLCGNCLEAVELWLGASKAGVVYVPINAHYRGDFLRHPLALAEVKALLVDGDLVPVVEQVAQALPALRHLFVVDGPSDPSTRMGSSVTVQGSADLCGGASRTLDRAEVPGPTTTNSIIFTAGTTGASKGVVVSHRYLLTSGALSFRNKGGTDEDVNFTPLPLFHGNAMMQSVLGPLIAGARGAIDRKFSVSRFWDRLRHHDATLINILGSMVQMLWNREADPGDRRHRARVLMGAPMPAEIHRAFEARFGLRYVGSYGLAEAWPILVSTVDDPPDPGWAGRGHDLFEVALLDDDDRPVPDGEPGEFACRPRHPGVMFDGYHRDPEATLTASRNLWFHTGDYGVRRGDGWYRFVDRKKDTIRRRGENVSSWEVERAASRYHQVAELAAFAVPSDVGEDEIMVSVVPHPGAPFDLRAFMDHCVEAVPYFAVPRYVDVVDDLPRSAMGKPLKTVLREHGVTDTTWDREQEGYVVPRTPEVVAGRSPEPT